MTHILQPSYLLNTLERRPRTIVGGKGSYLFDADGYQLLDMYGDNGAFGLGYGHPIHLAAIDALRNNGLVHSMDLYHHQWREAAAKAICEAAEMDRVFFCTSGTEGVEAAIKLARKVQYDRWGAEKLDTGSVHPRCEIWSINGGFHGRTYASMAASDGPYYHHDGFDPLPDRFDRFSIDNVEEVSTDAAAILMAPVFGVHNVIPYTREQLLKVHRHCQDHNILLIFDETQSGAYRTGHYMYWQHVGVKPDIVTFAKGAAGGFPIGGMMTCEENADALVPGSHFSTWGGNPASMVFLKLFLDYMGRPKKRQEIAERAEVILAIFEAQTWIKEVRSAGLLFALDTPLNANTFAKKCDEKGLIIGSWRDNPIRFTPPLDAPMTDITKAIGIMNEVAVEMLETVEKLVGKLA